LSAQKSNGPTGTTKAIENKMLDRRFAVAPLMDWTGTSQKAKRNQHLSPITKNHAVPNAVPIWFEACAGD
jgi:hypothetical protein